jgi:hypothetical protein
MAGGRAVTSFSFPCVSVPVFSMNGGGVGFKIVRDDDIVEDGPGSIETAVCIAPGPPPPRVFRRGQVTGQANPKEIDHRESWEAVTGGVDLQTVACRLTLQTDRIFSGTLHHVSDGGYQSVWRRLREL